MAALGCLAIASGASALSINFSGSNGSVVSQGNGDGSGLDVSYATVSGGDLKVWNGYSGGNTVAYANCPSCVGQITLDPGVGQTVVIDTIGVAAWKPASSSITIYNEDYSQVLYTRAFGLGRHHTFDIGVSSAGPVHIQWGQDAFNIGISGVGVSMLSTPQGLPEPGTGLLMLAAGAVIGLRRLRARA